MIGMRMPETCWAVQVINLRSCCIWLVDLVENWYNFFWLFKYIVQCTLVQALRLCTGRMAHRGSRGIALLFHDHGTRRGEGSASRPGRSLPPGKTWYPLYRRLGGHQGRSGQVRKISPLSGFDPRTVQAVASQYTDWATWPTLMSVAIWYFGGNRTPQEWNKLFLTGGGGGGGRLL